MEGWRYHHFSWDVVTQPKHMGGLGLHRLDIMSKAYLMKLGWELQNDGTNLCLVLKGKHGREVFNSINTTATKSADSSLWKVLVSLWPLLDKHSSWAIDNGIILMHGICVGLSQALK